MNTDPERFLRMKRELSRQRDEFSKLKGRREALLQRLKTELGCPSQEAARDRLVRIREGLEWQEEKMKELCSQIDQELVDRCGK